MLDQDNKLLPVNSLSIIITFSMNDVWILEEEITWLFITSGRLKLIAYWPLQEIIATARTL